MSNKVLGQVVLSMITKKHASPTDSCIPQPFLAVMTSLAD